MKEKKPKKGKNRNVIIDFGNGIELLADNSQYIMKIDNKDYYYVCVEHALQDMYEWKRKQLAMEGTEKTIKGFIDATLKAKEWMEKTVDIKYKNPYQD